MPGFVPPSTRGGRGLLGLDEAGRGSVIGPLVVGGFAVREDRLPELADLGVRDSKLLTPARRDELYGALRKVGTVRYSALSPGRIDRAVRHHGLNALEAEAFAGLVRALRPARVFVDACDPVAARFGETIARYAGFPAGAIDSRHKADRDIAVVSAASIVAKVQRDRAIARLAGRLGTPIGTGYPSDPVTRAFLRETLLASPSTPPWLRRSWSTTETLMPKPPTVRLDAFP